MAGRNMRLDALPDLVRTFEPAKPRPRGARRASRPAVEPILMDRVQLAQLLGLTPDRARKLAAEPWFPRPVDCGGGPRLARWIRAEVAAAVANMPRLDASTGRTVKAARGLAP